MTTRIHVVNFGPDTVEASVESDTAKSVPAYIGRDSYADFYVYDNHDILIKEVKSELPKQ